MLLLSLCHYCSSTLRHQPDSTEAMIGLQI
jgi:hypothetical protein